MKYFYIFSLFFFFGCYSVKKATKDVNKAQEHYPEVIANKCGSLYHVDTVTQTYYDTLKVLGDTLVNYEYDTIQNEKIVTKYVHDVRTVIRHEIKTVENLAEIHYLESVKKKDSITYIIKEANLSKNLTTLTLKNSKLKNSNIKLWLLILFLILLIIRKPILEVLKRI